MISTLRIQFMEDTMGILSNFKFLGRLVAIISLGPCVSMTGCISTAVGAYATSPSSKTELGTPTPLLVNKEQAQAIRVVALTTYPFHGMVASPVFVGGWGGGDGVSPIAFLTESIKNKGRFEVIPASQFRKKIMEMHETFDQSLTEDEKQDIAQRVGQALGADAVLILEIPGPNQGQPIYQPGALATTWITGRATDVQKLSLWMISTQGKTLVWRQTLQYTHTHGLSMPKQEEMRASTITPLVENLHESF
jgi:hypothetical protein